MRLRVLIEGLCTLIVCFTCSTLAAETQVTSASARWDGEYSTDVPEFRRHVVPLFSKLGCNMRNCHGSFQGQSGFRLSLFGFEPDLDQKELLEVDAESSGTDRERTCCLRRTVSSCLKRRQRTTTKVVGDCRRAAGSTT